MDIDITNYVPIPNYEGRYFVNQQGDILTVKKLSPVRNTRGYHVVALYKGKPKWRTVHSIVMEAFAGDRPPDIVINHKDGIKTHNEFDNLEYVTTQQNVRHSWDRGLSKISKEHKEKLRTLRLGQKPPNRKLSDKDALRAIRLYKLGGISLKDVGRKFGMSAAGIHHIIHGHTYRSVVR